MKYNIHYDIDLDKSLAKIPKRDIPFIKDKIESLTQDPRPRHGQYRIIYKIFDDRLVVILFFANSLKLFIF